MKAWRRALHEWDQEGEPADQRGQKKAPPRGKRDDDMKEKSQVRRKSCRKLPMVQEGDDARGKSWVLVDVLHANLVVQETAQVMSCVVANALPASF